mmetsp:Transcript_11687/g.25247  ORF Transcript_11687/g.25247 Transcript_11687/m.25247 type:complete len:86 (-) Transcript_11687:242-499(-)
MTEPRGFGAYAECAGYSDGALAIISRGRTNTAALSSRRMASYRRERTRLSGFFVVTQAAGDVDENENENKSDGFHRVTDVIERVP